MKKRLCISVILFLSLVISSTCFSATRLYPKSRAVNAVQATFARNDSRFEVYVWKGAGKLWIEVDPLGADIFICTSSFAIIQNGIQYNTVDIEKISGNSLCSRLSSPYIALLTQYSFHGEVADLSKPFRLVYESGVKISHLDFPAYSSTYNAIRWQPRGNDTTYYIDICDENWNIYPDLKAVASGENMLSWSPKEFCNSQGITDSKMSGLKFNWRVWSPGGYGGEGYEGTVVCP